MHLHTEVVEVSDRPEGVEVVLRDVASGDVRTVRARYLVAADGARSPIRRALGIAMRGPDGLGHVVTAIFRAPLWQVVGEHRYGVYSVSHPHGAGTFLPSGRGDRWHYGTWVDADDIEGYTPERFARRIRAGAGIDDLDVSIERTGSFSFAAQLADRFRAGNVFLAGDAAHRVTPRGGTGMNTAIGSGHDLGWKLGWVLRGWAGPELLDTYEAERRPIAAHNVARSADPDGSTREAADELHVDLGGRIPHVWVRTGDGRVSTLDLLEPRAHAVHRARPRRARGGAAGRRAAGHRPPPGRRSARARSASAVAARCSCAPTARLRGCGRMTRAPPRCSWFPGLPRQRLSSAWRSQPHRGEREASGVRGTGRRPQARACLGVRSRDFRNTFCSRWRRTSVLPRPDGGRPTFDRAPPVRCCKTRPNCAGTPRPGGAGGWGPSCPGGRSRRRTARQHPRAKRPRSPPLTATLLPSMRP